MDSAEATAINPSLTSDHDLRVSCYCEENAWRVVYRHLHHLSYSEKTNNNNDDDDANNNNNKKKKKYAYHVVFISNEQRCVPFFRQRAKPETFPSEYVCWDYHVIVLRTTKEDYDGCSTLSEILDVDTWLQPYPHCPIDEYLNGSFPHANNNNNCNNNPQYLPCFRVIPAEEYLKYFYSDRAHMNKNGEWLAPPPSYGCIMNGLSSLADNGGSANDATKQKSGKECKGDNSKQSNLEVYIDMKQQKEQRFGKVYTLEQFRATFCSR